MKNRIELIINSIYYNLIFGIVLTILLYFNVFQITMSPLLWSIHFITFGLAIVILIFNKK